MLLMERATEGAALGTGSLGILWGKVTREKTPAKKCLAVQCINVTKKESSNLKSKCSGMLGCGLCSM